jgi:nicotinamidase/pyrazinamidase
MIFWDVDTQRDFLLPGGKLYVPGAEEIIPNLGRLTCWAAGHKVLVVSSADAHQPNDPEFNQYPPHCLVGTPGQRKIQQTLLANEVVIPNAAVTVPEKLTSYDQIIIEKQQLDVFTNPNTDAVLVQLATSAAANEGPSGSLDIVVYGVVSEICVRFAALGLLDRGHRVTMVRDAMRHLEEDKAQELIEEVKRRGGKIVLTDEIVTG